MGYAYVLLTILLVTYGQLVLKWRLGTAGSLPEALDSRMLFLLHLLLDPFVMTGLAAAFVAVLAWMAALTQLELSRAYPFMSLSFVLVLLLSAPLLGEALTVAKLGGVALIVLGTVVIGYGK